MPVKTIDSYTEEYKLFNHQPLNLLKDCRIGIEAGYYLKQLLNHLPIKDPLIHATGSAPVGLKTRILRDLSIFEQNKIEPFFVFDGLNLISRNRKISDENYARMRDEAWKSYNEGKYQQASNEFGLLGRLSFIHRKY